MHLRDYQRKDRSNFSYIRSPGHFTPLSKFQNPAPALQKLLDFARSELKTCASSGEYDCAALVARSAGDLALVWHWVRVAGLADAFRRDVKAMTVIDEAGGDTKRRFE